MFLRCSYFFGNLSLNVFINMVLTLKNQCIEYNIEINWFITAIIGEQGSFDYLDPLKGALF